MSKTLRLSPDATDYNPTTVRVPRGAFAVTNKSLFNGEGTVDIQDTVQWPHPECQLYLQSLQGNYNLRYWNVPVGKDITLYRNVLRLKECLIWWGDSPTKNKIGSPYSILYENLERGPNFADEISDCLDYSLRLSAACSLTYGKEDFPLHAREIESVEQIFHPHNLIPFQRPDGNDIQYLFDTPLDIDEQLISDLRQEIRDNIRVPIDNKRTLDDLDRIKLMGSQSAFDIGKNCRSTKTGLRIKNSSLLLTDRFEYDTVLVDKQPNESRDAVVPTPNTAATLYLLRLQLHQVLLVEEDVIWDQDFSWLPEWGSGVYGNLFILSDQKKCGLTFPRRLLIVLFEELSNKFPDWDFHYARDGLANTWVKDRRDGCLKQALGGPGLGQFSEAISILVALIFRIWKRNQDPELQLSGKFFNDDQAIRLRFDGIRAYPLPDWVTEVAQNWDSHMESYGLLVHRKKPFICKAGLLLEIYGDEFPVSTEKTNQWVGNVFKTLVQPNIVAAKEYFAGLLDSIWVEERQLAINILERVLLRYWGYEFCPQETTYPYQFGGWFRFRSYEGLDEAFIEVANLPPQWESLRNLITVKKPQLYGGRKKDKQFDPLIHKVQAFLTKEAKPYPKAWNYHEIGLSATKAFRPSSRHYVQAYQSWAIARHKAFNKKAMPLRQFFSLYWELSIEEGKSYAPPLSVYHEGTNELPYGEATDTGKPILAGDPIRNWFRFLQGIGELNSQYEFYHVGKDGGTNHSLYEFLRDLNIGPYKRDYNSITMAMLVGQAQIQKFLEYGMRVYGKIIFPKPPDLFPKLREYLGHDPDKYIYLNHTGEFVLPTNISTCFEPELFRIERDSIQSIMDGLENNQQLEVLPLVWDMEGVENLLYPPEQRNRQQLNLVPETLDLPTIGQEEHELLKYLIYQIQAPEHLFAAEEAIRQGLAAQIYGLGDDGDDPFSDEEGFSFGFME